MSLILAGEHLRMAQVVMAAGHLYPSAQFTVLRGALVGASQAVWILSPDDAAVRRERGMVAVTSIHAELGKFYAEVGKGLEEDHPDFASLKDQEKWLADRQAKVNEVRTSAQTLNQTSMIHEALGFAFKDAAKQEAGRLLWRQMSADAHVLGWSVVQRAQRQTPERKSGLSIHEIEGDAKHIAQPFVCAFEILRRGWSLFDQRCEGTS